MAALTMSYDEQLALLDRIVTDGLAKLLTEARQNEHLEEPYGRSIEPTPLISEEEFVRAGGLKGCLPDEPDFNFQFGFNPLQYLSKFISWSHPDSVENRRQEKIRAVERLTARAVHAGTQLDTALILQNKVHQLSSGIYWGPFVSPIPFKEDPLRNLNDSVVIAPTCSVVVMCKTLKTGYLALQLSQSEKFDTIVAFMVTTVQTRHAIVGEEVSTAVLEDIIPVKVTFKNLEFGTKYFVRGFLSESEDVLKAPPQVLNEDGEPIEVPIEPIDVPFSQATSFWTLPSEDVSLPDGADLSIPLPSSPLSILCVGQLPTSSSTLSTTNNGNIVDISSSGPVYSALLGDLMYHNNNLPAYSYEPSPNYSNGILSVESVNDNKVSSIYSKNPLFNDSTQSLLRNTCVLLANRDSADGAKGFVYSEEAVHKQFRHDLRRYNKKYPPVGSTTQSHKGKSAQPASKTVVGAAGAVTIPAVPPPPTIKRLPLNDSLQSLLELFPVDFTEDYDPKVPPASVLAKIKDKNQLKALKEPVILGSRMLYRTVMIGPDIQAFVLDMRGSPEDGGAAYLGKEQAAWLTQQLMDSSCLWKVIMCGYSFGVVGIADEDLSNNNEETKDKVGSTELPVEVPLATTSGDPNDDQPQTKTKQFQFQVQEESSKPVAEEVDEVYARSKYSLPHILASVQKKYHSPTNTTHSEGNIAEVNLSSGIVLLSSGVCKLVSPGSAVTPPHNRDISQETLSPAFVAAYTNLLGDASPHHKPLSTSEVVNEAYCVEIGLGSPGRLSCVSSYGYLAGFDSSTLFVSPGTAESLCTTTCKLSLASDGALSVSLMSCDSRYPVDDNNGLKIIGKVLYDITLRTHLPEVGSLEDTEDGTSTVQDVNNSHVNA